MIGSRVILDENLYYKDILHLAEFGNEKISKTICLFLKQFLTEFRHPSSSSTSFLCPSAPSLLSSLLSSPSLPSSLVSPPPSDLLLPSSTAIYLLQSTLLVPSP